MATNKVVYAGTTLIDLTDTTATASDVAQGKYFYTNAGVRTAGTATGGTGAISVVDTTDSHGGTIRTITAVDISDTTAVASDVASGKYFYTAAGVKTAGTASGGGSLTSHTIHLEFTDSTDTDIGVDYDNALIGTMITAYSPSGDWTYNNKTVDSAALDNVTWYQKQHGTWETLYDDDAYIQSSNPNYIYANPFSTQITADQTWRVTFDGDEWTLTTEYSSQLGGYIFGNGTMVDGSLNPTCPFVAYKSNSSTMIIATTHAAGHIALKIEILVTS